MIRVEPLRQLLHKTLRRRVLPLAIGFALVTAFFAFSFAHLLLADQDSPLHGRLILALWTFALVFVGVAVAAEVTSRFIVDRLPATPLPPTQAKQTESSGASATNPSGDTFRPPQRDLKRLVADLEEELRLRARDESQTTWTAATLKSVLRGELRGEEVLVVSNREPYVHQRRGDTIVVNRPASGLVTALEPVMRACSGVWIAHGSGSADRDVVDARDHVAVPPDNPAYELRRIWLSPLEEEGFYYGFANEGLWPLCHIAHVRPTFRTSDWEQYLAVNQRFADAVVEEAKTNDPIVLVQDYHFALLPRMIRERLPKATIITFWHIPWPNPEVFTISPWATELVEGLLGSSILGFHAQAHCLNFMDTVDRLLEARVDRETYEVTHDQHTTAVRRYPISIEWPPAAAMTAHPVEVCRREIRAENNLPLDCRLGVGVDRIDYTKGIIERFRAIERLLELNPEWIGRFAFVQISAPSRSRLDEYQSYEAQVRALATRINERFCPSGRSGPPPIILKIEHHPPEMPEALIINPYNADQCAAALHLALTMPAEKQALRMRLMRRLISEFNVYRWAGRMLLDAAIMRQRSRLPELPLSTT
ncbi:MAG: trehalose-6-phosphate synthase [Hydrogenophilus thermoluteolus]